MPVDLKGFLLFFMQITKKTKKDIQASSEDKSDFLKKREQFLLKKDTWYS